MELVKRGIGEASLLFEGIGSNCYRGESKAVDKIVDYRSPGIFFAPITTFFFILLKKRVNI